LLLAALLFLPIVPGAQWKPAPGEDPAWRILLLLTVCLGLPYFVLAATGPLLQAWFSRLHPGVVPYRLYALSNAGSLLALVTYPFVFEPALTRQVQARLWAWSFGVFALLCGACALRLWRLHAAAGLSSVEKAKRVRQTPEDRLPTSYARALWFCLPACASVLLLATTNKLCQDVAAIPFLWILPLSLYLLTFILCFDRPAWYWRNFFTLLLVPMLALLCFALFEESTLSLRWQIATYGGSLFVGCMVCHGEVYRLKPMPHFLTSFYLLIAAGGAAGAALVALVAPMIFRSYAELNWGGGLLAALVLVIHQREQTRLLPRSRRWRLSAVLLPGVLAVGSLFLLQSWHAGHDTFAMSRNFYGVLRVIEVAKDTSSRAYLLKHGNIKHGLQFATPAMTTTPTTYYNEQSGVGLALTCLPSQTNRLVGVVGLGTGTLAAYGRPGDRFRFYEIDPEVRRLAEAGFTFLKESSARVEVIPGDARLSLEGEPSQQFDLLVLDAFSSDSIPVHLLTKEAFTIYFRHLKPDGVLAVHISNRHLNLFPVIVGLAKHFRLLMVHIQWTQEPMPLWLASSNWLLLSHNRNFMTSEPILAHAHTMPLQNSVASILWTDDHASLFRILRP